MEVPFVGSVLVGLFLLAASVKSEDKVGAVFDKDTFKLTCPYSWKWRRGDKDLDPSLTLKRKYDSSSRGLYSCYDGDEAHYFYVKGNPCASCVELEAWVMGVAIAADVVATVILMTLIFRCSKKESSGGAEQTPRGPARSGGRAPPPVTSPDYERLNHTRSDDPYSFVNRTG